jgi:putative sugar O-methyltransferase
MNRAGSNYVSLRDQQPISVDDALRAKAACLYVRSLVDQRGTYIESHGLDRDVWMPAANWHAGQSFYRYAEELLAGNTDLIDLLRIYSQQFSGNALWSMTSGDGQTLPPLERALIEERQRSIELDDWALDIWAKLRDQLPEYLRISPPAKFGEVGWRVDGTLVNRDTVAYWERLLVLYRAGFLDRTSPRRLHEGSRVLEIGGGYGALAWFIQEAVPGVSYTMVDLPESLVYSAIYLDVLHPGSTRFHANYEFPDILRQVEACDLAINTLSMSEMSEQQVRAYCVGIRGLIGDTGAFFEQNQDNTTVGMLNAQQIIAEYFSKQEVLGGPSDRQTHLMQGFANVWRA